MEERSTALKRGILMKLASLDKQAQFKPVATALDTIKGVLLISILTGLPIGVAAHHVGKRINPNRSTERDLNEQIKLYKDISHGISNNTEDEQQVTRI